MSAYMITITVTPNGRADAERTAADLRATLGVRARVRIDHDPHPLVIDGAAYRRRTRGR